MAYDEELADRIRTLLDDAFDVDERRMFGGLAFLAGGNMAVAVTGGDRGLMVRVEPAEASALVARDGGEPFAMRGRALKGWVLVAPEVVDGRDELEEWLGRGLAFARTLPPKA
jgi:TfoX/Sxy family transcriptional regulator of competence genes